MFRKNDKDPGDTERGLLTRIIEGVIVFVVLGFAIRLGVEAITSVKVPLLVITLVCAALFVGYRIYKYVRDRNDY